MSYNKNLEEKQRKPDVFKFFFNFFFFIALIQAFHFIQNRTSIPYQCFPLLSSRHLCTPYIMYQMYPRERVSLLL